MNREALKLALEALEVANSCVDGYYIPKGKTHLPEIELAITAIKEALAQPEQEPLGFMNAGHVHEMQQGRLPYGYVYPKKESGTSVAVYTTPPQREQEPVTIPDCGEAGHADGACGNRECLPSFRRNTTPPQRTWVGLTEKDICEAAVKSQEGISPRDDTLRFAIVIEAKLKEKNT